MTWRSIQSSLALISLSLIAACHSPPPAAVPIAAPPSSRPVAITAPSIPATPATDDPRKVVLYLASDALEGRAPGTHGLVAAGDFLAARFAAFGLSPAPGFKDYFQPFTMPTASTLASGTSLFLNDKALLLN